MKKTTLLSVSLFLAIGALSAVYAQATKDTQASIEVSDGTLTVDITTSNGTPVATPGFVMGTVTSKFEDQSSAGTLGVDQQMIVVSNPTDDETWDVTIAATKGSYISWSGASDFDPVAATAGTGTISSTDTSVTGSGTSFTTEVKVGDTITASGEEKIVTNVISDTSLNVSTAFTSGLSGVSFQYTTCTEFKTGFPGDNDDEVLDAGECHYAMPFNEALLAGNGYLTISSDNATIYQAIIDPATGDITGLSSDANAISNTSSSANNTFEKGVTDSITIFAALTGADDYQVYVLKGLEFTQNIPAMQEADTYNLHLTLTVI